MGISLNQTDTTVKKYNFKNSMKKVIPTMDYLTHGIHPYTAKLIPHIPRYFIEKYTEKGEIVLDPFCGSGTTLLEARLLERNAIGIDINPLAKLISEVKTTSINAEKLDSAIQSVKAQLKKDANTATVEFPNIDYWFCKHAQNELAGIKFIIERLSGSIDCNIYKFLQLCFSSIIRKSSYADPRIAKTYKSKRMIEKSKSGWIPKPIQYFEEVLNKNFERVKALSEMLNSNGNYTRVFQGDARQISSMLEQNGIGEVDFIITSPPYINAQDYFRSYKLELWWLGLATPEEVRYLKQQAIGTENLSGINRNSMLKSEIQLLDIICNRIREINGGKSFIVHNYFKNMRLVFEESYKILKRGGHFCLITGNNTICGVQVPTYRILADMAEVIGFKVVEIGTDKIKDRALPPSRNHDGGIIKDEWITVFQKGRN